MMHTFNVQPLHLVMPGHCEVPALYLVTILLITPTGDSRICYILFIASTSRVNIAFSATTTASESQRPLILTPSHYNIHFEYSLQLVSTT